jgi:hypothetical protein
MMKKTILLTVGAIGLLFASSACRAQTAATTPDAYVNENPSDPAPLKLREVEGTVRGLGRDPMSMATVSLFTEQGHTLVATVISDKNGKFKFGKVDNGPYRLVVKVAGLCPANVPILKESNLLAHNKVVITMQPKDVDKCSYGMAKR